ncbi:MAG: cation-translocating P-type ATPase [Oryzihumus sp.]
MDSTRELTGLSGDEARRLLAEHGPNLPPEQPRRGWVRRVGDQLRDSMMMLLLAAFVVTVFLGDVPDATIIAAVVVLNSSIGVIQEVRAEHAVAALGKLAAPHAVVLRDGHPVTIGVGGVVPGDLARLEAGDVVPADAVLIDAHGLQVDESAMTGESVPVDRTEGQEVLAGTVVTHGRALAQVTRTGARSGLGRIAGMIAEAGFRPTPLQQRLTGLSHVLVVAVVALSSLVFALGLLRGEPVGEMLILAVSLAVAAIPESLPAVVSVALALGAHRMARRNAVVRWLPAVETLGSVTVLASDKTGTLTEGRMCVGRLATSGVSYDVTGLGYAVAGEIRSPEEGKADETGLADLLRDLVLCNDARLTGPTDGTWTVVGDPMEAALLVAAAKAGVHTDGVRGTWTRVHEEPFDAGRQRMSTLDRAPDGRWLVVCKGAPEVVLGPGTEALRDLARTWAEQGLRVIAVAEGRHDARPGDLEEGLVPVGLVGVADPPRAGAREVVAHCQAAGIRLVLVTGDHAATARAVADDLGITAAAPDVVEGPVVARGEHLERVDLIGVYARTKPEQKVDIVKALQQRGDVVAMTGDGVNDAPALRTADIGVAMGDRGTEVARQAADLVLADDDLGTVIVAVAEGRRIFSNIRTFLRYGLSGGLAEVAVLLIGPFLGMPLPLLPAQILWINMLTHGLPGVAFGGEPLDPVVMARPSTSPQRSVLGQGLGYAVLRTGAAIGVVTLAAGLLAKGYGEHVQTWVFLTLGLTQLVVALALRAPRAGTSWRDRGLEAAVAGAAVLQVAGVAVPALRDLLGTQPVGLAHVPLLLALSVLPGLLVLLERRVSLRRAGRGAQSRG